MKPTLQPRPERPLSFTEITGSRMDPTPLTMDELARAAQLGSKYVMEHMSLHQVLELSYGAGGVYPTLVGYALGAISTLFFVRGISWAARLVPALLCVMILLHTSHSLERKSLEWLLIVAAATGVCCTYVQLASLDLVREHFVFKEMPQTKDEKKKKND